MLTILLTLGLFAASGAPVFAETRLPNVAGSFYPAQSSHLREGVEHLLTQVEKASGDKPRALIAPHAGYAYSGPVAASAFSRVEGHTYDGVVVVAFTHQLSFPGVSIDTAEFYETPLGQIPVDQEAVGFLLGYHGKEEEGGGGSKGLLRHHPPAHSSNEHSLEVMLPFLQVVLGDFKLVPILMGEFKAKTADHLAEALAALQERGDYLFVFSTDLSHYHPYETAVAIDGLTVEALQHETSWAMDRLFSKNAAQACGKAPILTALSFSQKLGYLKRELIQYANSGDTAGDHSRVVGYAALALYEREAQAAGRLSEEAGMALVHAARQSVEGFLREGKKPEPLSVERWPELSRTNGVFVTLRRDGLLCGCIGRIETDEPLAESVSQVALDAALRDSRFPPVKVEELDQIHVEVSVLTPSSRLARLEDLVPGRDGVVLEFEDRRGVFLPTVWESTGWTREKFLRELASQKAHLSPDAWKRADLFVFQDQVFEEDSR